MHDTLLKEPTQDEIANCAYYQWQKEGSQEGHEQENWFAAETSLMKLWLNAQGIGWTREA